MAEIQFTMNMPFDRDENTDALLAIINEINALPPDGTPEETKRKNALLERMMIYLAVQIGPEGVATAKALFTAEKDARIALTAERIATTSDEYWVNSGQEMLALGEAAAKGASAMNWSTDPQNGIRTWKRPGLPHSIQITPLPDETGGMLETLTGKLSVTSTYALLYISKLLITSGNAWIDLSDVAEKVGRDPRSSAETAQCRQEVHDTIVYGDRAIVIGERSIPYFDKTTNKTINTHIHSALWRVTDTQYPDQLSLYGGTPAKVRLVLSAQFQAILENPALRQILPFGELLGSIPGKRAAGAYARAIGLMLVNFWRRRPNYALCGTCYQTRRELLTTYPPEVAPPQEVLDGRNPKRAIEYYYGGLGILRDLGIVAPTGDADPHKNRREGLPEQDWQEKWLNAVPEIHPGPIMLPALEAIAGASYAKKPKLLGAKRNKKSKDRVVPETQ